MLKTLREIYNGNIDPIKKLGVDNKEIKNAIRLLSSNREKLEMNFDEKTIEQFEKYTDCVGEYESLLAEEAFCCGCCLGIRIVSEALTFSEEPI